MHNRARMIEDYPPPIVDHAWARERTLATYGQARADNLHPEAD
jgi:deoxyribodipyrimidine photolyase